MTRLQSEFPRDVRNQAVYAGDALDIAGINQRLRSLYQAHNNLPGSSDWLYAGKDVPYLSAWTSYHSFDLSGVFCLPRFRRVGYDYVEIEGVARQNPFNGANVFIWRMPDGFIPYNTKSFTQNSANGVSSGQVLGLATGANAGLVLWQGLVNTDFVWLDNIRYSLIPSR